MRDDSLNGPRNLRLGSCSWHLFGVSHENQSNDRCTHYKGTLEYVETQTRLSRATALDVMHYSPSSAKNKTDYTRVNNIKGKSSSTHTVKMTRARYVGPPTASDRGG